MPGGGIRLRSPVALERELQTKLNQTRIVQLARNQAKRVTSRSAVVRSAGEPKLSPVEGIEELGPEFQAEFIVRSELGPLEDCQVPVIDTICTERGINTSFRSISVVRRRSKASRIERLAEFRDGARRRGGLVASGNDIGSDVGDTQPESFQRGGVGVRELQWEALLEGRNTVDAPSRDQLIGYA